MLARAPRPVTLASLLVLSGCIAGPDDAAQDGGVPGGATTDDADPGRTPPPASPPALADPARGRASSAPGAPLTVALEVSDARAFFGEGAVVTAIVTGNAAGALRAGLSFSDAVDVVRGNATYAGPFEAGEEVRVVAVLRASAPGAHVVRAWAELPFPVGSRAAPSASLAIVGSAAEARFETPAPEPPRFTITLAPAESDASRVTATIEPAANVTARVAFLVPDRFGDAAGAHESTLALRAGERHAQALEIGRPAPWEEGYVVVSVYLYPDPALDGRLYSDALYYSWHGERLVVSEAPPGDPPPSGSAPGSATGDPDAEAPAQEVPG